MVDAFHVYVDGSRGDVSVTFEAVPINLNLNVSVNGSVNVNNSNSLTDKVKDKVEVVFSPTQLSFSQSSEGYIRFHRSESGC